MDSSAPTRRPCFIEEDDGLASLVDMEAGISGNKVAVFSRSLYYNSSAPSSSRRRSGGSFGNSSPRSGRFFYDSRFEEHHHRQPYFLDACSLCQKPLVDNRDIFMYRGDTPFCSEECRQEQIDIDEAKEKSFKFSMKKALRKKEQMKSDSPNKSSTQDYPLRTSTVAAA